MRRREFIIALAGAALVPSLSQAQKPRQFRHIGILLFSQQDRVVIEPCLHELRTLGYVDGKTIAIEYRDAEGNYERLRELAAELVSLNPDVIFSFGGEQAPLVKAATASIPIVVGPRRKRARGEPRAARRECHGCHLCSRPTGRKDN
jgi:putative tryptophan/tyrosine transport system substrate-binding protein